MLFRSSPDNKWQIIKAQTSIGKTERYLEELRDTSMRVLIAVPTNNLKSEVRKRAESMGIEIIESPSLHEIKDDLPDDVWEDIERLLNSGKSVFPYLNRAITKGHKYSKLFKKYKKELDDFNNSTGHAITTHKRLLNMDASKYDVVIVDEDIIYGSIVPNRAEISISDLRKLLKKIPGNSPLADKIREVLKRIKKDEFFSLKKIKYDEDAYEDIPMAVDISSFCLAKHFCYRKVSDGENNMKDDCICFFRPVRFNKNVKHIMLSATVDETICKYYFKDNMKFAECKKARYEGTLNQYYDKSMSRACIDKDPGILDRIRKWSGFNHAISFLKYGLDDRHFEGIKPNTVVVNKGYKFRFTTYDDERLRAIQFWMIESELEQAVGRARLLRKNCIVNLYSNFPISQSNLKKSEYDKDITD